MCTSYTSFLSAGTKSNTIPCHAIPNGIVVFSLLHGHLIVLKSSQRTTQNPMHGAEFAKTNSLSRTACSCTYTLHKHQQSTLFQQYICKQQTMRCDLNATLKIHFTIAFSIPLQPFETQTLHTARAHSIYSACNSMEKAISCGFLLPTQLSLFLCGKLEEIVSSPSSQFISAEFLFMKKFLIFFFPSSACINWLLLVFVANWKTQQQCL